jgi:monoamine oxidase
MTRDEFIKRCGMMGLGAAFMPSLLSSCNKEELIDVNFSGKVLIIGAGAAGMMAGYMLQQYNIDFQIIEASSVFGGRVKKIDGFADFPIDLGGEWIHTRPSIFGELIDDDSVEGSVDLISYKLETLYNWNNGVMHHNNWATHFYGEYKFKNSTWYDFFAQYIVPSISSKIVYNSPVTEIDYSGAKVNVTTSNNTTFEGDKVLVTVPIAILKSNAISFVPSFPSNKVDAMNNINIPPGIKVFIEFAERFYPDITVMGPLLNGDSYDKLYYDAAFKKDSSKNILALFYVSDNANELTDLTNQQIIDTVIAELDEMFEGKASQHYMNHVIQNWSAEPYIQGSYSFFQGSYSSTIKTLLEPIDNKVHFAGEALIDGDSATVHGAGQSAKAVIKTILEGG